jgi:ATP-binding cassette subfamily B protein
MSIFNRFPHFNQLDSNDCGPACLKIIFDYYDYEIPFAEIRNKSKLDWQGTSLYRIESIARDYEFKTMSVSASWEKIAGDAILPAIFMINQSHFAVIYKIDTTFVYVSDPAIGRIKYKIAEFRSVWETESKEGIVLLLHPTKPYKSKEEKIKKDRYFLKEVKKYVKGNSRSFTFIFSGLLLGSFIQLLLPFSTQLIIDDGIRFKDINLIVLVCAGQFIFILSKSILDLVRRWILVHLATIFNISLIHNFLLKLIRLPLAYFEFKSYGDLLQRIEDHNRIDRLINSTSLNAAFSIITFLLYGSILLLYNGMIFLCFFAFSLVYFIYNVSFTKYRKILDYKRFQQTAASSDSIFQMVFGINEIKIYQAEFQKLNNWKTVQAAIFKINVKSAKLSNFQSVGSLLLNESKNFVLMFYCSILVIRGELTLGMMFTVQYIVGLLNGPIQEFINFLNDYIESQTAYDRIVDIYDFPDEGSDISDGNIVNIAGFVSNAPPAPLSEESIFDLDKTFQMGQNSLKSKKNQTAVFKQAANINYDLKITNASFKYQKSYAEESKTFMLKNINFSLKHGQKTAIVGSSGSGKTTLLKLILRFYPVDSGNVYLNTDDFYNVPVEQWRSLCSSVLQDGYIFSDTITNNIALGDLNPIPDKVEQAAKLAEIFTFIDELPTRFETFIGSNGHGLSQGQKQRILIARAIYKDSPFFLFDEATSSLDSLNERNIMDNIYNNLGDKTMLIIAHRLSTVIRADEILVMDKGEIVERGTHKSLIRDRGIYYELIKNQIDLENT